MLITELLVDFHINVSLVYWKEQILPKVIETVVCMVRSVPLRIVFV
jgi:hypothetical protein